MAQTFYEDDYPFGSNPTMHVPRPPDGFVAAPPDPRFTWYNGQPYFLDDNGQPYFLDDNGQLIPAVFDEFGNPAPIPVHERSPAWTTQGVDSRPPDGPVDVNPNQGQGAGGIHETQPPFEPPSWSDAPGGYVPDGWDAQEWQQFVTDMAGKTTDIVPTRGQDSTPTRSPDQQWYDSLAPYNRQMLIGNEAWDNMLLNAAQQYWNSMFQGGGGGGGGAPNFGGIPNVGLPQTGGGFQDGSGRGGSTTTLGGHASGGAGSPDTQTGGSQTGGGTAAGGTTPQTPSYEPLPMPQTPSYTFGYIPPSSDGSGPGGSQGSLVQVPGWLEPFLQQTGGAITPELMNMLGQLGVTGGGGQLPSFPGTGGGAGTAGAGGSTSAGQASQPGAQLPQLPTIPGATINFPDLPQFTPIDIPPGVDVAEMYRALTGQGGSVGAGGATGSVGGSVTPGQGGVPGGGGGFLDSLFGEFQQQTDAANAANEQRYQDILAGYGDRSNTALEMLANLGLTEKNQIKEAYERTRGQTAQSLTNRGLSNTTVLPGVLRGIDQDYNRAMGELQQRINQTGLGVYTGTTGDRLQFMERRNDVGPDQNLLAQLAEGIGAGGFGGGGTGTSGGLGAGSGTGFPQTGGGFQARSDGGQAPPSDAAREAARQVQSGQTGLNSGFQGFGGSSNPVVNTVNSNDQWQPTQSFQSLGSFNGGQSFNTGDMNPIFQMPQTGGNLPLPQTGGGLQAGGMLDGSNPSANDMMSLSPTGGSNSSSPIQYSVFNQSQPSSFSVGGSIFDSPEQAFGHYMNEWNSIPGYGDQKNSILGMMNSPGSHQDLMGRQNQADIYNAKMGLVHTAYPELQGVGTPAKPKPLDPMNQQYFGSF